MKKFLFIIIATLLIGCNEKKIDGYADASIARKALQVNIYNKTVDAGYRGFVEEKNDSATVEALREEADRIDSLVVSCLIIEDCMQDTVISVYNIK